VVFECGMPIEPPFENHLIKNKEIMENMREPAGLHNITHTSGMFAPPEGFAELFFALACSERSNLIVSPGILHTRFLPPGKDCVDLFDIIKECLLCAVVVSWGSRLNV